MEHEIDTTAEIDSNDFWILINYRRKKRKCVQTFEMKFRETVYNNPVDIYRGWMSYFRDLYSPTHNDTFDSDYLARCDQELATVRMCAPDNVNVTKVPINEILVEKMLNTCKKGKAGGIDQINYENLIYGGHLMINVLTKTFLKSMYTYMQIPTELKRGIISTLYKGGNKRKCDPNSYRAISLCSTILKLYEKCILNIIDRDAAISVNDLQGGFQKNISCTMTSFILHESIYFAKENHSKLYACFLDVRQAFDRVSHSILMMKLYNTGIDLRIFQIILNMFENVYSCVQSQGHTSDWFPIRQGTRQGQVISPRLYLLFINDLMDTLESSPHSARIHGISYGCPTSADDMVLVTLMKNSLDTLMDICYQNSLKKHYLYNAGKCNVMVFNKNITESITTSRTWRLGPDVVDETDKYVHLGILCEKNMNLNENIQNACTKLRTTFFGLGNCGVHKHGLHPITIKHLYQTIVLPRALFGCELCAH